MTAVLARRREFEDTLGGRGSRITPPEREYTKLADDIRLRPNYSFSLQEAKEIEAQAIQRRRYWEDVRMAASAAGVPLHEMAVARGAHLRREKEQVISPDHDELFRREQTRREADAHRRDEQILANVEASRRQAEEALNAPKSLTDQIAEAQHAAGRAGGAAGGLLAGGVGHDAGQFLAGKTAKGSVYAADAAGQATAGAVWGAGKVVAGAARVGAEMLGFEVDDPPRRRRHEM